MNTRPALSLVVLAVLGLSSFVACGSPPPPAAPKEMPVNTDAPATGATAPMPLADAAAPVADAVDAAPSEMPKLGPSASWKGVGLSTPESVLYDDANDLYLVSNIGGPPLATDNNGFISQLSPDGTVKALKFIAAGQNGVKLDAPKGLAISGDFLFVADITTVRMFDRKSGMPKGEVKIPGSTFLNDLATGADGKVYVTDSGLKSNKAGKFDPSGTDAIYSIDAKKKLTKIVKSKDLKNPNGLLVLGDKIWVNTFGASEIFVLGPNGEKGDVTLLPKGSLDGFVALPSGDVLVSSWDAAAIYRGKPGGGFTVAIPNVKDPADIGYDTKRGRVLVPLFSSDAVEAYELK